MKDQRLILMVLLIVVNVGLSFYLSTTQSAQLNATTTTLREELRRASRASDLNVIPAEVAQKIENRLEYLTMRQDAILDEAKTSLSRQATVFTTVAAFLGLFTFFFGFRQFLVESRGTDAREKYEQEMRGLVQSFQNNITTISSLLSALEEVFRYRQQIQDELQTIKGRAADLERSRVELDEAFGASLDELNRDAVMVAPLAIDRAALNHEENRRLLETFAGKLEVAERSRNTGALLNPFCYYVRGLARTVTYQYHAAITDFKAAARRGREDLSEPHLTLYALEHREKREALLADMLLSCDYFQGVCHKNVGEYAEATTRFAAVLERNRRHFDALSYWLQVRFFDDRVAFRSVEEEFSRAIQEFRAATATADLSERDKLSHAGQVIEINFGDIYHRKLLSPDSRAGYRRHEDPEKAVAHYRRAHELASTEISAFSLAQALENVGSSQWLNDTPRKLYEATFTGLKSRVADQDDKLYSVFQYYMLAVCAAKLRERATVAEVFLSQARHCLREVPQNVTCLSPISRIRLSRPQILEEMESFEKLAQGGAIHAA